MPVVILILLICLLIPIEFSFEISSLRLTPYRLFLILIAPYLFFNIKKIQLYDYLLLSYSFLTIISLIINSGLQKGVEFGGINTLEGMIPYLIARKYITNEEIFIKTVKLITGLVISLGIFGVFEAVSSVHLIHDISRSITGYSYRIDDEIRAGFTRAYVSFEHPILYGMFCSSVFSLCWFCLNNRVTKSIGVFIATSASLSSAPILLFLTQIFLIVWDFIIQTKNKWKFIYAFLAVAYVLLGFLSNRPPLIAILSHVTLDPRTSYYRSLIFTYGMNNVANNPFFGLGFNDWVRPVWMVNTTVDNFWLLIAMRYGIPALVVLLTFILLLIFKVKASMKNQTGILKRIYLGWVFSLVSLMIGGITVNLWFGTYAYFFFLLGMGVWMVDLNKSVHRVR